MPESDKDRSDQSESAPEKIYVSPEVEPEVKESKQKNVLVSQQYCGPLPPPQMLKDYEQAVPGLAESLTQSFIKEGDHRRELERKAHELDELYVCASIKDSSRGSFLGFILCAMAIAGGVYAAVSGAQVAGSIIGFSGMAGLVVAFKSGIKVAQSSSAERNEIGSDQSEE